RTTNTRDEDLDEVERALRVLSARRPDLLAHPIPDVAPRTAPPVTPIVAAFHPRVSNTNRVYFENGVPFPATLDPESAPQETTPRVLADTVSPPPETPKDPVTTAPAKLRAKEPDSLSRTNNPIILNQSGTKMRSYLFLTGTPINSPFDVYAAATYLQGQAYSFFEQEVIGNEHLYSSLDDLLDGLHNHFLPTTWRKDLFDRFERAMPVEILEELMVQRFLNAMDPLLQSHVQPLIRSSNTLNDAVTTAERYEAAHPDRHSSPRL
ncbi:hypothetical protein JCM1840_004301, partial [Sporobolomyces johnsonii]